MFADLQGRRVLVTGASRGIGLAVAAALLQHGAKVVVSARQDENSMLGSLVDLGASIRRCHALSADLTVAGAAAQLVDDAANWLGGLDVVVNNAGGLVARRGLAEQDGDFSEQVMALNGHSALHVTRAALPHLLASVQETGPSASVIGTGSIAGWNGGGPGAGLYAAAKAWLHAVQRSWVKEYSPQGIRFNTIAPGTIETEFHADKDDAWRQSVAAGIPLRRLGQCADLVPAYLFLSSHRCSGYITGHVLDVNGGQWLS